MIKKTTAWILLIMICLQTGLSLADGDIWYCPECGRQNDSNFCPKDGTARPKSIGYEDSYQGYSNNGPEALSDYYPGISVRMRKFDNDKDRRQSYAGPGTNYSTAGAYKPYKVQYAEAFFEENGFVFVRLCYQTVDDRYLYFRKSDFSGVSYLPYVSEPEYWEAITISAITPSWGPSGGYTLEKEFVAPKNAKLKVFFRQNGYVYAEYECGRGTVRMWLPENQISWL